MPDTMGLTKEVCIVGIPLNDPHDVFTANYETSRQGIYNLLVDI